MVGTFIWASPITGNVDSVEGGNLYLVGVQAFGIGRDGLRAYGQDGGGKSHRQFCHVCAPVFGLGIREQTLDVGTKCCHGDIVHTLVPVK